MDIVPQFGPRNTTLVDTVSGDIGTAYCGYPGEAFHDSNEVQIRARKADSLEAHKLPSHSYTK